MKKLKKADLIIVTVALLLVACIVLSVVLGTGKPAPSATGDTQTKTAATYSDFKGKRIGIRTGTSFEELTMKYFPDSQYLYFDTESDLVTALTGNKIDAFMNDEPVAEMIHIENNDVDFLKPCIVDDDYCFGFPKNKDGSDKLMAEFNEVLSDLRQKGELDKMKKKWLSKDNSQKTYDKTSLTGENGTLLVAVIGDKVPFSYMYNNELTGYNIELVTIFARAKGYNVRFEMTNVSGMLAGLASDKYDIAAGLLSVTEERKKSINFSDCIYKGGVVLVARSTDLDSESGASAQNTTFFKSIADSFNKNFIREARYMLILEGIGTTSIITVLSVLCGSVLAFFICLFRRINSVLAGKICSLYVKFMQGTPMIVLLMMLYYVIFGKSGIDAIWVAVIGFSLNFSAYASEILRSGIESIDGGQREAALALGLSENQAFFRFIFPQAALRQMPVYRGEIITLLKNTSIVGYIAIQDLTKMSDIIRSRTYEAFFPLISTAVIYFILAWIIALILKFVFAKINPKAKRARSKEVKA